MTSIPGDRLGLVGQWTDPVSQLLQDFPAEAKTRFVEMNDPSADIARVDRVLVLSQQYALAYLPELLSAQCPVQILVRRSEGPHDQLSWQSGIQIFSASLRNADRTDHITLVALSSDAAEVLSKELGMPVAPLPELPVHPGKRPPVAVKRDDPVLTFTMETASEGRETRRVRQDVLNWARLRRLGAPLAADTQDEDMVDLCEFAGGSHECPAPARAKSMESPCMVVVVPNGTGLGHVTRMMAICKELQEAAGVRSIFWSYSRAAEIVQASGFEVILRQNAVHLKAHPPHWRQWETAEFASVLKGVGAKLVCYDGGSFDPFIVNALRHPGCGHIGVLWVRRGMMRPETDASMLESEQYCDLVLEPGDLASEVDIGPTRVRTAEHRGFSRAIESKPMTLKPHLPSYSRREAKRKLELGFGKHCLVSLGGAFGDWSQLKRLISEESRANKVRIVWAKSPLAPPLTDSDPDTVVRQFFPLNRYLNAFDGVITAAGYNSFHELMLGYEGPVLLAPTNNVRLDNQEARAKYAGSRGWADVITSDNIAEQGEIMKSFMRQVSRKEKITTRPSGSIRDKGITAPIIDLFDLYS